MARRKRRGKRRGKRRRRGPGGVVSKAELRHEFKQAWRECGSPRKNPKCWSRRLKRAWGDV